MNEVLAPQSTDLALKPSFHAVAVNATEMAEQRDHISSFLQDKVAAINLELAEITAAYETARTRKWASGTLKNQVRKITAQKTYYDKLLAAVDAGLTIVPNMPCDIFAIRVDRTKPLKRWQHGSSTYSERGAAPYIKDEREQQLPIGEGHYESPVVDFEQSCRKEVIDGKVTAYHVEQHITNFQDIEFPLAAAHPVVMKAADAAMKKLVFDRIGIVPQTGRKLRGDPIILGQIVQRHGYNEKVTSFLIAWHLDVRSL